MGTGKTVTALGKIVTWMNTGLIKRTLIVSPLSVIPAWANDISRFTDLTFTIVKGGLKQKIDAIERSKAPIMLISYDTIPGRKTSQGLILSTLLKKKFDFIICDEVTYIKSRWANRTQAVTYLCDHIPYHLFLSGTPITNDPTSIITIYRALDKGETFGRNFFMARRRFFIDVGWPYPKWVIKHSMKEEVTKRVYSKAVRVTKDECLDLPPKIFLPRYIELNEAQAQAYSTVASELRKQIEIEGEKISIPTVLTKLVKLAQITSGFLYTEDKTIELGRTKIKLLNELLQNELYDHTKIVVFSRWSKEISMVVEEMSKEWECLVLDGSVPEKQRGLLIKSFQESNRKHIFISNIDVGKFGITLSASSVAVYLSLSFSVEAWLQSQDRIHRISQTKKCLYIPILASGTIDTYIYNSLRKNLEIAKAILDWKELVRVLQNNPGG